MIWITTDENYYYDNDREAGVEKILNTIARDFPDIDKKEAIKRVKNLFYDPSKERLHQITDEEDAETSVIVSPRRPDDFGYAPIGFFTPLLFRGINFPFTEEQLALGISKSEVLEKRLGLAIMTPTKTLDDMAGATELRRDVLKMLKLESIEAMVIAGLFLFGVAGAGKSFFAECFAGQTKRHFVILDLPYFMSLPFPTRALDEVFDFLLSQKQEKYLLLIDEIEKMFDFDGGNLVATQVFGKLLTRLNDIYSSRTNNITFVATANNITKIMSNNPEFLRKGRFNRLYFLNYPSIENAKAIFNVYKNINKKRVKHSVEGQYKKFLKNQDTPFKVFFEKIKKKEFSLKEMIDYFYFDFDTKLMISYIESQYSKSKQTLGDNFIYAPPEIQAVAEELQNDYTLFLLDSAEKEEEFSERIATSDFVYQSYDNDIFNIEEFTVNVITSIVPLQISASQGVAKQLAQSRSFKKGEGDVKQFIEIS